MSRFFKGLLKRLVNLLAHWNPDRLLDLLEVLVEKIRDGWFIGGIDTEQAGQVLPQFEKLGRMLNRATGFRSGLLSRNLLRWVKALEEQPPEITNATEVEDRVSAMLDGSCREFSILLGVLGICTGNTKVCERGMCERTAEFMNRLALRLAEARGTQIDLELPVLVKVEPSAIRPDGCPIEIPTLSARYEVAVIVN